MPKVLLAFGTIDICNWILKKVFLGLQKSCLLCLRGLRTVCTKERNLKLTSMSVSNSAVFVHTVAKI